MASAADDGSDLTDRIYEAAFVPEFWSDVLGMLGGLSGSPSGSFFVFDDIKPIRFEATELVYAINESFCSTGLWRQSQRIPYYQQNPMTGFVIGQEYYPADFLDADSSYVERRKLGLEGHAGTIIPMPTGEMIAIAIEKWAGDGPFTADDIDKLDIYYSHLARAGLMAARLGLEQARATASALQAIGLPAAVMSSSGRVKATNKLFDEMGAMFLPVAFGGMAIADPAANQLFQQAIVAVGTDTGGAVRSIPVKAKGDDPPVIIHVLPLRRSAHDIFSGADIIVAATAVSPSALVPTPTILTGLFDLAPSEARLAVALTQGRALKAFASEAGITFSTARKYLDRIYLKTGTHRQSELVALLKGAQPLSFAE